MTKPSCLFACLSALLASALLPSAATAFDPTNLTGCVMWLQAASANVQTNPANGRVSQWNDLSGSGNHATQSDTNRQPLYVESGPNSLPTVYFDMRNYNNAYNARLLTGTPLTNACTTYLVARVLDGNELGISWRRLLGSRDKNWLLGTYTPGTFYAHGHNGELSGLITRLKSAYRFNRTYTLSSMNNTTSQYFYVNGHDLTGDPTKSTPPGRLSIGSVDGYNDEGEVQISEVLAYDRELSAAERQQVQDYLTARYGITDEGFSGPVWSGGSSSSSLWSDSANWQQPMPAAPMLAFYGNSRRTSTNDLTGLTLDSVLAWDGSWQLSGNPVTLNNGFLCNPATEVTWGLDTALPSGPHTFSVLTARRLTLSGVLSGDGGVTLGLGPDYAGTLALACPSNTFTGPVLLKGGIAEVTRLANAGQPSSLGAASGANAAVLLGNLRMGHSGGLRYVGSASASTDRPFSFIRLASIENNSPTGAGLTFNGAWAAADKALAGFAYLSLGGTSTGINTVNTPLANAPGGANALFVNVKGGVWAFTQPSTFTGTFSVDGGTVLVNGTSAGCLGASNVKVMPGATLGGTGLATSTGTLLQYPGAIISPGDPTVNGGIGCLTYGSTPGLSGVRLRCQVNAVTNDSIKINASVVVPGFMTVELVAASAAACPNRIRIIEATSMTGAIDLSGWEIEAPAPCVYRAVREGNAIVLVKDAPLALSTAWQRSMPIRFGGYTGSTALTNFPALVKLWDGCGNNRFRYRDCVANGADLLFTDDAGVTLQHEIEIWNTNGESHVWVQVPVLVKNTQITAYWKNPSMAADANLFLPTNLPNCGLWLHAGAGLTTNATGNVSVWADQSGNGRNATQGTAGAQPVWVASAANGLPALRFEAIGTKDGMATGWNATNKPYSYFVVGAFLTNSGGYNWRRIVQGSSGYNCGFATEGAGKFFLFTANPGGGYTLITNPDIRPNPGTPFVAGMIGDGTNTSASLNGFVFNTVAVHCGPNFLSLGASGNSGDGWAGDVQEVIAYDRALSYDERRQVERYLALKYDSLSAHRVPWTGLRQWIRGDTVNADVLDGSTPRVSKCENQTDTAATMHATQSTTNRMPEKVSASFNGKPALRFDAVAGQYDGLKAFATPIGKAYSVVAVYSTRATDAVERVVMQGANSASRLSVTNGVVTRRASGVVSQLLPCQTNTPVIATLLCDEITSRFYVNGVNLTQSTTPVGPWGATGVNDGVIFFGAGTTDSALDLPLDGDLAEVLVYDRIISDTERRRIEAYLGARYAIPVDTSNPRAWSSEFSGVWHFTGADRLLLADASSAQNGAALLGQAAPAATNAFAGQGLTWGSAAQLGRTRTAPAATPQTYSFWAKQAASPAAQALILAGTNGQPYAALNNTGNQLQVAGTDAAALVAPTTGAWTHYAVAVNPNGSVQAYGNGLPLSTVPTALAASLPTNQVLTVGHAVSASDATKTFAGTLDELRTETVSRGADWIRAAYMTQAQNDLFTSYNRWGTLILLR